MQPGAFALLRSQSELINRQCVDDLAVSQPADRSEASKAASELHGHNPLCTILKLCSIMLLRAPKTLASPDISPQHARSLLSSIDDVRPRLEGGSSLRDGCLLSQARLWHCGRVWSGPCGAP